MIAISLNGERRELVEPGLEALVLELASSTRGLAVAVNGEVVPRSTWSGVALVDGDRVEVLQAAAGG